MPVGEHGSGREMESRATLGLLAPVLVGCQGSPLHQGCGLGATRPLHLTAPRFSLAMGRIREPSQTHTFLHSGTSLGCGSSNLLIRAPALCAQKISCDAMKLESTSEGNKIWGMFTCGVYTAGQRVCE